MLIPDPNMLARNRNYFFYGLDRVVLLCLKHNIFFGGSKKTNMKCMGATFVTPQCHFSCQKSPIFQYFRFRYSKSDLIGLFPYVSRITYLFLEVKRPYTKQMGATYVRYSMYMTDLPPPPPEFLPMVSSCQKTVWADSVLPKLSEYIKFFAF